jgi:hypothetical protein
MPVHGELQQLQQYIESCNPIPVNFILIYFKGLYFFVLEHTATSS